MDQKYGEDEDSQPESISMVGENGTKHLGESFFSTYSKCDILLNNSCEVFNNYILEAREMSILSMIEQVKNQLMTRYFSKEKEVGEVWQGPICPKIRQKVHKISEWANTCFAMPATQGIFQVQDRDYQFVVDIEKRTCDCRRLDLTGIPCSHVVSCLRHERISTETMVHDCYSSARFLMAYGPKIMSCRDKSLWENVSAHEVLPPVYEKKVGRPPKNRRKQPVEIQGAHSFKMSRHGMKMRCSYCRIEGHNRNGCELKKSGVRSKLQPQRHIPHPMEETGPSDLQVQHEDPIDYMYQEPYEDVIWNSNEGSQPLLSQLTDTMISQLDAQSFTASTQQQPSPDSFFIMTNIPTFRPVLPTTALKGKRPRAGNRKKDGEAPKKASKRANKPTPEDVMQ